MFGVFSSYLLTNSGGSCRVLVDSQACGLSVRCRLPFQKKNNYKNSSILYEKYNTLCSFPVNFRVFPSLPNAVSSAFSHAGGRRGYLSQSADLLYLRGGRVNSGRYLSLQAIAGVGPDTVGKIEPETESTTDINKVPDFSTTVTEKEWVKKRLDIFLSAKLPDMSRAKLQGIIKAGKALVNGAPELRPKYALRMGDRVSCEFPPPVASEAAPEDIPLEVVFEDPHLIVINKRPHFVVHPGPGHQSGTLVNAVLHHCGLPAVRVALGSQAGDKTKRDRSSSAATLSDTLTSLEANRRMAEGQILDGEDDSNFDDEDYSDEELIVNGRLNICGDEAAASSGNSGQAPVIRPGIVHRLDKGTSGLIVVAKDDKTHQGLCEQFAARTVKRSYVSVTVGVPSERRGRVEANVGRSTRDRQAMAVVDPPKGRHAASKYLVREELAGRGAALVEWRLETGRTHQIRVHAKHLGYPLFGDDTYGGGAAAAASRVARPKLNLHPSRVKKLVDDLARPALHARTLGFIHPVTQEEMYFQVDPPEDFQNVVDILRRE